MLTSTSRKDILLSRLRTGEELSGGECLGLTFRLAVPAILAQLSMCLMTFIDAAMVGRLGAGPAAAVGLVSTATWLFGSLCYASSSGFNVQVAHRCGARDYEGAKTVFRHGFVWVLLISGALALLAGLISARLPFWLGGGPDICGESGRYFLVYALFLPAFQAAVFAEGSLIACGNIKVPSIVSMVMCVLDVLFNYVFIFLLDMGVAGAALGTGLSELCAAVALVVYVLRSSLELRQSAKWLNPMRRIPGFKSPKLYFTPESPAGGILMGAVGISWPLWVQNIITRGAYVAATVIVAPLGTVAIAANSFAVIAEGFCYLPGFGIQDAATTLVGQSLGANRPLLARRLSWTTIWLGVGMMAVSGALMWVFAPQMMGLLTSDPEIIALGVTCLRIEAFAEPLFGLSIVANGCCVGAGDTKAPAAINLLAIWIIRIGLSVLLVPKFGLKGYWMAMAIELSAKGVIFFFKILLTLPGKQKSFC